MNIIEIILEYPGPFLAWMIPIFGAIMMPVLGKINHKIRDYGAVAFAFATVLATASMIPYLFAKHMPGDIKIITWLTLPNGTPLEFGVLVDPLSIIICNVVAFISFLIVVYSTSYMQGDRGLTRYWFLFLFFIGNMLLLVLADNLLMTMIGWEGVGICSYGLIGYYYNDAKEKWLGGPPPTKMYPPSHAGMKAFVVTGIGDVFILGAIFILYNYAGTFNYVDLINHSEEWLKHMAAIPGLISIMAVLLLGGPIGKSAQFPLHEWLPEAMAGPTSVSALIHAATMVKAGVYLVARLSPIFYIGTWVLHINEAQTYFIVIGIIGAFTCFLAASQALVSVELKKILAYSTVSQIGYMMMGLGLSGFTEGAYLPGLTAGIYHLASHAMFKAALFLGAGSVIHAVESIYTFNMGGLKKHMPKTYWLMVLATLSLSGVPIFSGFWSKDSVFIAALVAGTPLALILLVIGVVSAAMTFTYSIRYISNTFRNDESKFIQDLEHHGHHIHEAPSIMWGPIAVLVALFCITGLLGFAGLFNENLNPEIFIEKQVHQMLEVVMPTEVVEELVLPHITASTKLIGVALSAIALAIGGFLGYNFYWVKNWNSWTWVQASGLRQLIYNFLWNRWYMNSFYYKVFVDGLLKLKQVIHDTLEMKLWVPLSDFTAKIIQSLSNSMYHVFEEGVIFGGINNGVPTLVIDIYNKVKKMQTGLLSINIFYFVVLLIALILGMILMGGK